MPKISPEEIIKLSKLARIGLTESEVASLQDEMSSILDYVEMLDEVDVSNIEPTSQVTGLVNQFREDVVVSKKISREELLKNAPAQDGALIKVKAVL